jgi:hypothetical protein
VNATTPAPELMLRLATSEDRPVILDSWTRSYFKTAPLYLKSHGMSREAWIVRVAEYCLATSVTCVACVDSEPSVVLAWGCGSSGLGFAVCHYLYTMQSARGRGLARFVVAGLGLAGARNVRMTHNPGRSFRPIAHKMRWTFRPITPDEMT